MSKEPIKLDVKVDVPAAEKLIKKVSAAIGAVAQPLVAKAEVAAAKIRAVGDLELLKVQQMKERALARISLEQQRDQKNIESVVARSLPYLEAEAEPDKLDDDWLASFFEQCRLVSNEEMQELWGRILAGEANLPGSFSRRTLRLVADLDRRDAEAFAQLCRFAWLFPGRLQPLVMFEQDEIYRSHGVGFGMLTHLDDIGLIAFKANHFVEVLPEGQTELKVSYRGQEFLFIKREDSRELDLGRVLPTLAGEQLAPICNVDRVDGFADYVVHKWLMKGYSLASVLPEKAAESGTT